MEDDSEKAENLIRMGVDGIVSNQPEGLKPTVEKYYK